MLRKCEHRERPWSGQKKKNNKSFQLKLKYNSAIICNFVLLTNNVPFTVWLKASAINTVIEMTGVGLLAQETGIGVNHLYDMGIVYRQPELIAFLPFDKWPGRIQSNDSMLFYGQIIANHSTNMCSQWVANTGDLLSGGSIMIKEWVNLDIGRGMQ